MKQFFRPISPDLADALADAILKVEKTALNKKQKESLHISESCKENSDSFTDEDERIRKVIVKYFEELHEQSWINLEIPDILAWLEKQKEQKPADDKAFEEWLDDWYQGSKGISGYVVMNEAEFKNWSRGIKNMYQQKLDIALIQRSWYMEGYHDREFGMEPRWIIKTGEGRPKHELNPKYGQPLVDEPKPAWSEEDERIRNLAIEWAETMSGQCSFVDMDPTDFRKIATWLKSLRPSWKPSEEQMEALAYAIQILDDGLSPKAAKAGEELEHLRDQLKKL